MSLHAEKPVQHTHTILTLMLKSFPLWAVIRWALILTCQIIQQIQRVCMRDEIHVSVKLARAAMGNAFGFILYCLLQHETIPRA